MLNSDLAIVLPTLNEADSIAKIIDEIYELSIDEEVVVIVVDGYSEDGTDEIAREKGAQVIYQRGKGYGNALKTGFLYVKRRGDVKVVVTMDADYTYDPNDIPRLIDPILKGKVDFVVGNRFVKIKKGTMPFVNNIGNRLISGAARLILGLKISDTQCGLRAFSIDLLDSFSLDAEGMPLAIEMLVEAKLVGAQISEIPVAYRRRIGSTKLNPLKDGLKILVTMVRLICDTKPLLFFGGLGGLIGLVGFWLGLDITLEWFKTHTVVRLPTVMLSVLLMIGAMQFITLGLVADMIKNQRMRTHRMIQKLAKRDKDQD